MSKIAVFGGTGYAGGNIVREASGRGHEVTSYTRNLPDDTSGPVGYEQGTVFDEALVEKVAAEADVIVLAISGTDDQGRGLVEAMPSLSRSAIAHGTRIAVVGGAGSLVPHEGGTRLVDTDVVPDVAKPGSMLQVRVYEWLKANGEGLDWLYVSPALRFGSHAPGEATGKYRVGGDVMVTKEDGTAEISGADYALGFVDELEQRNHVCERINLGH